jgi:hypothetical protein
MDVGQDRRRSLAPQQLTRLASGNWPARAQGLIEASYSLCVDGLHEPVQHCMGEFEQKLFTLADRAQRSDEQQDFFASRQRVLQDRTTFQQRFLDSLVTAFNELGHPATQPEAAALDARPWQSLELLDPVVQELTIVLAQLGARGEVRHSGVLHELGYRLAVLIGAPPLDGSAIPLGPHALTEAFHRASAELALPLQHQLLLLQLFDQWVISSLARLYGTINAQLQADGILPQIRSVPMPRQMAKRLRPDSEPPAASEASLSSSPAQAATSGSGGGSIAVLESLRDLLAQQRAVQSGAHGAGRAASESELQAALGALQQHLAQVTDQATRELRSAARLREELLAQLNLGKPAGQPATELSGEQGDTVELVAGLFEQLGQQLQQGSNASALLSNLQLPVLRMAVADKTFLEKREHPARRLLDTVTSVAHEWLDGSDDETNRPLATKLEQLVNRAGQQPPSTGLYTSLLADIEHHLGLLTRKAQAAERRHVEAAQGRDRLDQARQRAGELMAERFAKSPPRGLLRALLDRAWTDVLALTLLRHGEASDAFRAQLAITDQLLGSVPTDDRRQLQQDVELGLQQIGMHAEESVQVAQRLIGAGPEPVADLPSATDLALRLKKHHRLGEQQAQPIGDDASPVTDSAVPVISPMPPLAPEPSPRDRRIEQHLRSLPFGSWFEFVDPSTGQISQRKLAWYSPMSGRCLLVTRRGQRSDDLSLVQLAHEIASGRVCEVQDQRESMLDRAWRSLTGILKQKPDAGHGTAQE